MEGSECEVRGVVRAGTRVLGICGALVCTCGMALFAQGLGQGKEVPQVLHLTPETHVSLGVLVAVAGLLLTVCGGVAGLLLSATRKQQRFEDHIEQPHLEWEDVRRLTECMVVKEVCRERHLAIEQRLQEMHQDIKALLARGERSA